MLYDNNISSKRILLLRKEKGMTQEQLSEKLTNKYHLYTSRQKIGRWEKGEPVSNLDELKALAHIFNCEIGYILGEYDCKTRTNADIQKETGLSETAIEALRVMQLHDDRKGRFRTDSGSEYFGRVDALDFLINSYLSDPRLLENIRRYLFTEIAPGQILRYDDKGTIKNPLQLKTGDAYYNHTQEYINSEVLDRAILQLVQEQLVELKKKIMDDKKTATT